jgi:hypothetical protein
LRTWVTGLVIGLGLSSGVAAQATAPQAADTDLVRARQRIFMMEGVLERAVQLGVDNLRRRVRAVMPDDSLLQGGAPQVRGFRLDGYGVFFDVEVPALRQSLAWSIRTMNETGTALARDLAAMRAFIRAIPDPRVQAEFERTLRRVQQQVSPVTSVSAAAAPAPGGPAVGAQAVGGQPVSAQSVGAQPVVAPFTTQSVEPPAEPPVDPALLNDPSDAYTEEVKAAVIDAMIENSGPLMLGEDEWLTVAARDNAPTTPFLSGDPNVVTLVIRVKGSDISAFRAGTLTLDQVRARVQVGEF